jgi:hypothetical protein
LPLAAGKIDAGSKALADDLIVSFGKLPNDLVRQAALGGDNDARAVIARLDAAYGDIVGSGE